MSRILVEDSGTGVSLTPDQQDVLNELINIGFGRGASALSMLVNQRVLLNVPQLRICPITQIDQSLSELADSDLINVHQVFSGKLSGSAMLLMDLPSAAILIDLLNGGSGQVGPMTPSGQEALAEVGNIVTNAFLGAFGNLLKIHLTFTVPLLRVESLVQLLSDLSANEPKTTYAMIVKIRFQLSQQDVTGFLVVVMDTHSLDSLMLAMETEGML